VSRITTFVWAMAALAMTVAPASAQDSLQSAKDLYASAAYDDALSVLGRLRLSQPKPEVEQYRVLCLVALGRQSEAEATVRGVVEKDPSFVPDASEVSPRIQELFARTRKELLPDIARRMYVSAKAALDRKDRAAAQAGFDELLKVIDSQGPTLEGALPELRLLAAGFLDLSRALPAPASEAPVPVTEPLKSAKTSDLTPPVAIRQVMPQWVPSDTLGRQGTFTGAVLVSISASGRVEAAVIQRSIHPAYDRLLLQAARAWEYQPARSDGTAVASEQLVQVQLKPRQ
jgi:TonB family protein